MISRLVTKIINTYTVILEQPFPIDYATDLADLSLDVRSEDEFVDCNLR